MISGMGMSVQDYGAIAVAFEKLTNSTAVKKIRKILKIIRQKD